MTTSTRVTQSKTFNFSVTKRFPDGTATIKKYFTKAAITSDYGISSMTMHRVLFQDGYKMPVKYKDLHIERIRDPARQIVQLEESQTTQ